MITAYHHIMIAVLNIYDVPPPPPTSSLLNFTLTSLRYQYKVVNTLLELPLNWLALAHQTIKKV